MVINCIKQGVNQDRISQMIKALPDSYLPDEADLMLYKHMNTIRESQSVDRAAEPSTKQFDSINSLDSTI